MKPLFFLADALNRLREFSDEVQSEAGYELFMVQRGEKPRDYKPFKTVGPGVEELRVRDEMASTG